MRPNSTRIPALPTRSQLHAVLVDALAPLPDAPNEVFFGDDIGHRDAGDLRSERRLLEFVRAAMPPEQWRHPTNWWRYARLERIAGELASRGSQA